MEIVIGVGTVFAISFILSYVNDQPLSSPTPNKQNSSPTLRSLLAIMTTPVISCAITVIYKESKYDNPVDLTVKVAFLVALHSDTPFPRCLSLVDLLTLVFRALILLSLVVIWS